MKNKMQDVRNHLVAMMESLGEKDCRAEEIEKAKAMSMVASQYISSVKTEIDALRLADEIGQLPAVIGEAVAAPRLRAIAGGR